MIQLPVAPSSGPSGRGSDALFDRSLLAEYGLVFLAAGAVLFLLSGRNVLVFDEGILLTDVMRTMHGQVFHRDFNYNYGPAQLYLLAGLFKLFGPSVFADRLAAVVSNASLALSLYIVARRLCGRALAVGAACLSVAWSIGLLMTVTLMNPLLCALTLWASWLILPTSDLRLRRRRALWAGLLAGIMFLFRYDIGLSIAAANVAAIAAMMFLQRRDGELRVVATVIGLYVAAFVVTILPFAVAYLSVAPLHDLVYDIVIYMSKYYRVGRGLPFPVPRFGPTFRELAIYLVPVIIGLSLWMGGSSMVARRRAPKDERAAESPGWAGLMIALGIAAAIVCAKGLVRTGIGGMYGSVNACVLLAALLIWHRGLFNGWLRGLAIATIALFGVTCVAAVWGQVFGYGLHLEPLVVNRVLTPNRQPPSPPFQGWCQERTPITRGFCYLLDNDHIQAVEFLAAHTTPNDTLFVGLTHHDRIFANDMITYFAVQRLPAVKWAEFDPFLQNRADIQQEMIARLKERTPPYIMLDREFDTVWEPNGSSVSTGVHLLDQYIAAHYQPVEQYGNLAILHYER